METYLCENQLNYNKLKNLDWEKNTLVLGLVLGISDKSVETYNALHSIVFSQISPILKGYSIIKMLEILTEDAKKSQKDESAKFIPVLNDISDLIIPIKPSLSTLKDTLATTFTKTFNEFVSKYNLSNKLALLAISGLKNIDLIQKKSTLFELTIEDLTKLDQYATIDKYEILTTLEKGCEIIYNNKLKAGDPLSILIFNTLNWTLSIKKFGASDVSFIENSLIKYANNFSPKQKIRLLEDYKKICRSVDYQVNNKVVSVYESNAQYAPDTILKENKESYPLSKDIQASPDVLPATNKKTEPLNLEEKKGGDGFKINEADLRHSVRTSFKNILNDIRSNIKSDKRIEVSQISESFRNLFNRSAKFFHEALYDFSYYEKIYDRNSCMAWKIVSKSLSFGNIFEGHIRSEINMNIDYILNHSHP